MAGRAGPFLFLNMLEFDVPLLLRSHKDTDLRPLLVSTVTRMWCELHVRDVKHFRSEREELDEEGAPMAVDAEGPPGGAPQGPSVSVVIAGKNRDYPHRLAGFIRDKEYVERLLELVGGCPRLPEAGALTADQIYAQVKTDAFKTSPAEALQQHLRACCSSFRNEAAAAGVPVWKLRQQIAGAGSRALW